ncbi:MAG TPA: EthD domain-containing protein [Stellaceae bacterium]|nr:EthD domain-containing protein [Stellaceae bacterium]
MPVKLISLIKRKPGMSRQEFMDYYETTHVGLGLRHTRMSAYRRNYVMSDDAVVAGDDEALGFDVITESLFPDAAALEWTWNNCASPEVRGEFEADEAKFIDTGRTAVFQVEQRETRMPETNRARVERLAAAMVAGDWTTIETLIAPDAVIREAPGLPFAGDRRGHTGLRDLARIMATHVEEPCLALKDIVGEPDGESFAVLFRLDCRSRASGRNFSTDVIEYWRLSSGVVGEMTAFYRDAIGFAALDDPSPG